MQYELKVEYLSKIMHNWRVRLCIIIDDQIWKIIND